MIRRVFIGKISEVRRIFKISEVQRFFKISKVWILLLRILCNGTMTIETDNEKDWVIDKKWDNDNRMGK